MKPSSVCWQSCFAVRLSALSRLAWYIVLCSSVLWSVISIMCSGAEFDASGVGRVSGMFVAGRLLEVMFAVEVVHRLA